MLKNSATWRGFASGFQSHLRCFEYDVTCWKDASSSEAHPELVLFQDSWEGLPRHGGFTVKVDFELGMFPKCTCLLLLNF